MEKSIFIRDTEVTIVEVLELLASGYSIDQIVKQIPKLSLSDVLGTIKFAADVIDQHVTSEDKIEITGEIVLRAQRGRLINLTEIRKKYPRAFEKWTTKEDNELVALFKAGHRIDDIAKQHQRKYGGIKRRLEKLELLGKKPPGSLP